MESPYTVNMRATNIIRFVAIASPFHNILHNAMKSWKKLIYKNKKTESMESNLESNYIYHPCQLGGLLIQKWFWLP